MTSTILNISFNERIVKKKELIIEESKITPSKNIMLLDSIPLYSSIKDPAVKPTRVLANIEIPIIPPETRSNKNPTVNPIHEPKTLP